jgi:hypothetical protein
VCGELLCSYRIEQSLLREHLAAQSYDRLLCFLIIRLFANHSAELDTLAIPTSFHNLELVGLRPRFFRHISSTFSELYNLTNLSRSDSISYNQLFHEFWKHARNDMARWDVLFGHQRALVIGTHRLIFRIRTEFGKCVIEEKLDLDNWRDLYTRVL